MLAILHAEPNVNQQNSSYNPQLKCSCRLSSSFLLGSQCIVHCSFTYVIPTFRVLYPYVPLHHCNSTGKELKPALQSKRPRLQVPGLFSLTQRPQVSRGVSSVTSPIDAQNDSDSDQSDTATRGTQQALKPDASSTFSHWTSAERQIMLQHAARYVC